MLTRVRIHQMLMDNTFLMLEILRLFNNDVFQKGISIIIWLFFATCDLRPYDRKSQVAKNSYSDISIPITGY